MTLKKKRLGHEYAKRRHLEKKKVRLWMPRFFVFFNYLTKKMTSVGESRRAADSGFVGVLVWSSK